MYVCVLVLERKHYMAELYVWLIFIFMHFRNQSATLHLPLVHLTVSNHQI